MTTTLFRTSKDIEIVRLSRWLNWACSNVDGPFIALPMIQRGSVWRPHQVIDLWDSLLQGMPIGSMMVSELKEGTSARQPGKSHRVTVSANGGRWPAAHPRNVDCLVEGCRDGQTSLGRLQRRTGIRTAATSPNDHGKSTIWIQGK